jgi:hypothetical protein
MLKLKLADMVLQEWYQPAQGKIMAEDEKTLKTGNLKVRRDGEGNRYVKYVDEDENLGKRTTDSWVDVDAKVQQFFGYASWDEYKADNQADLTRKVIRDEEGKVTSAPTLWPFHVAYTLEEFRDTLDKEDYAVVGVPKNEGLHQRRRGVVLARQIAAARKDYFKPGGQLDQGMKSPRETLTNEELVGRAKERLDFNSAFQEILKDARAVHPETVTTKANNGQEIYWAKNIKNYRDISGAKEDVGSFGIDVFAPSRRVDAEQISKNEQDDFLMENLQEAGDRPYAGESYMPGFKTVEDWKAHLARLKEDPGYEWLYGKQQSAVKNFIWDAAVILDPSGVLSIPYLISDFQTAKENPSLGNITMLSLSILGVLPLVKVLAKPLKVAAKSDDAIRATVMGVDGFDGKQVKQFINQADAGIKGSIVQIGKQSKRYKLYKFAAQNLGIPNILTQNLQKVYAAINKIKIPENIINKGQLDNILKSVDAAFDGAIKRIDNNLNELKSKLKGANALERANIELITEFLTNQKSTFMAAKSKTIASLTGKLDELAKVKKLESVADEALAAGGKVDIVAIFKLVSTGKVDIDDVAKALKKAGVDDDAILLIASLIKLGKGGVARALAKGTWWGTKKLFKILTNARLAKALNMAVKDLQGTREIPSVPMDETNIEYFLLPRRWYANEILTENEIFITERLMIKARPQLTKTDRDREVPTELPSIGSVDALPPEEKAAELPAETDQEKAEREAGEFQQQTDEPAPESTLDPEIDLTRGRGVVDRFENYPWTEGNPYVVGQGTAAVVIDGPKARVWEFDNAKDKTDEYFEGVKIDAEDFQVGPTTDPKEKPGWEEYEWDTENPHVNSETGEITNNFDARIWERTNNAEKVRTFMDDQTKQKDWSSVYPWTADPYNETPEQNNPHVEGDTPPNPYGGPGEWEPAIKWEVTNRSEKWKDFKNTEFAKNFVEGSWEKLERDVGAEDVPQEPETDQPEDTTPESVEEKNKKNRELANRKWAPALFGATGFNEQLVNNIMTFQKQQGLDPDGKAGPTTMGKLYRLLNRKYRFDKKQMRKFKDEIVKGKTSEEAAKSVIDDADSLSEDSLRSVQKQMLVNPEQDPVGVSKEPLEQFKGTQNVKVIDPRTAFAHPEIHEWLSGLKGSWVIGDISLPFGGGSHPTSTEGDRSRDYENTVFSHKKIRFNHSRHKFGTHVDFQIPLKQGGFNAWDSPVDADDIDYDKVLDLLKQAKDSDLIFSVVMAPEHIERLKVELGDQVEDINLKPQKRHNDHIHIQFPPTQTKLEWNLESFEPYRWYSGDPVVENKILEFLFNFTDEVENELV